MKALIRGLGWLLLGLGGLGALPAYAADEPAGLTGLTRVGLELEVSPDLAELDGEILRRVEATLAERRPAPLLDAASPAKLRLAVRVEALSASELRGFWLPFSSLYAIGSVRLGAERPVLLPGAPPPAGPLVPAVVWQAERIIATPWRRAGEEVLAAVDDLLTGFLQAYRQARRP